MGDGRRGRRKTTKKGPETEAGWPGGGGGSSYVHAHTAAAAEGGRDLFATEYHAYCWCPDYKGTQLKGPRLIEHHGEVFNRAVPDRHNPLQEFPRGPEEPSAGMGAGPRQEHPEPRDGGARPGGQHYLGS